MRSSARPVQDDTHPSTSVHSTSFASPTIGLLAGIKKLQQLQQQAELFSRFKELPLGMALDTTSDPTILEHAGRPVANFGTNNYLGTTHNPLVVEAAKSAIDSYGVGATASRLAGGTHGLNLEIETKLNALFGRPSSIIFSTGFSANAAVLGVVGAQHQRIFIDEECHASLYQGAALSGAKVTRFRHNDVAHLKARFQKFEHEGCNWLVVVDGLYSMSGSVAPLSEILSLRSDHPFSLLVDEAHSFGTVGGRGLGVAEEAGLLSEVEIITGTFSKAVGSIGGFATFSSAEFELLRFLSSNYIYTAALPPATLAAISTGLDLSIARGENLRAQLWNRCDRVRQRLSRIGKKKEHQPGPIFSVEVGDPEKTVSVWERLLAEGFYSNLVLPPASPGNTQLIRLGISARHRNAQIDGLLDALEEACAV